MEEAIINIVLIVLSAVILVLLILMWLRAGRLRKCRDCRHFAEHYITAFNGQGLFRFGYCQKEVHNCKTVEPDIERRCRDFERKIE